MTDTTMKKTTINVSRRSFSMLVALGLVGLASSPTSAHEISPELLHQHVKQINCIADDLADEIKCHFKGKRGYGKLLGLNFAVRGKSAQICRRLSRKCDYRLLCRDIRKLGDLICSVQRAYDDAMERITRCGCPASGCVHCVGEKIALMQSYMNCIKFGHSDEIVQVIDYRPIVQEPPHGARFDGVIDLNGHHGHSHPGTRPRNVEPLVIEPQLTQPRSMPRYELPPVNLKPPVPTNPRSILNRN